MKSALPPLITTAASRALYLIRVEGSRSDLSCHQLDPTSHRAARLLHLHIKQNGFDHGAGHPLLFLDDTKAPNCQKNNGFNDVGNYSEWPKVAGAVIQASKIAMKRFDTYSFVTLPYSIRLDATDARIGCP